MLKYAFASSITENQQESAGTFDISVATFGTVGAGSWTAFLYGPDGSVTG